MTIVLAALLPGFLAAPVLAAPVDPDYVFAPSDASAASVVSHHAETLDDGGRATDALVHPAKDDALVLLGLSQVKGEPAYKFRVTHADGSVEYHWISRQSFRELKSTHAAAVAATPAPTSNPSPVAATAPASTAR